MSKEEQSIPPLDTLRSKLPENHEAHAELDALHAEMSKDRPSAHAIRGLVQALHRWPELEATLTIWWNAPNTQHFIEDLTHIGL
ncbi:MAG TPA: hypothetical protein VGZ00_02435 [Candidatus Baltobacteraceae bacterium]|jgi:hypothetical protein|nr:hypothetical protein [Candidatus Baltobacteraceae bacterium]